MEDKSLITAEKLDTEISNNPLDFTSGLSLLKQLGILGLSLLKQLRLKVLCARF